MTVQQLRREIKKTVDSLPEDRLPVAADFLTYLQQRKDNPATRELLSMPGFLRSFRRGVADANAGQLTDWRGVRSDV